jgi:hypothetical protein
MSAGTDPLESSASALARVGVARRDQLAFLDAAAKDIPGLKTVVCDVSKRDDMMSDSRPAMVGTGTSRR